MAYFGSEEPETFLAKIQPRVFLLGGWLLICSVLLAYVISGDKWSLFGSKPTSVDNKPIVFERAQPVVESASVLVPVKSILSGQKLKAEMFKMEDRPIKGIDSKVTRNFSEIEGAYAASLIASEAPLLKDYITFVPPVNAVTSKIPSGYRGVTISVNEESAVEGWVHPGARVDVVLLTQLRGRPMVTTIVQNAQVLSAQRSVEAIPDNNSRIGQAAPSHVTLLVTIQDAQRIQVAKASGSLSLNLRGSAEEGESGNETITADRLLRGATEIDAMNNVSGWVNFEGRQFRVGPKGQLMAGEIPGSDITTNDKLALPEGALQMPPTSKARYKFQSESDYRPSR